MNKSRSPVWQDVRCRYCKLAKRRFQLFLPQIRKDKGLVDRLKW
jgi:hypothetical protein